MAWWDWGRWEREIDWMALNGINLPLALTGGAPLTAAAKLEWKWCHKAVNVDPLPVLAAGNSLLLHSCTLNVAYKPKQQ